MHVALAGTGVGGLAVELGVAGTTLVALAADVAVAVAGTGVFGLAGVAVAGCGWIGCCGCCICGCQLLLAW